MTQMTLYCDFDGTITEKDNIMAIMKEFAPTGWENIANLILSREISIRNGVEKLFQLISSSQKKELIEFAIQNAKIRPGFKEFVQYAQETEIPFYIVSGGLDFFVYPILEKYGPFEKIYCNEADFSKESISIHWPYPCDSQCSNNCGCCKSTIMRRHDDGKSFNIVIGDSVTDLEVAKQANFVLARDFLLEKCQQWGIAHEPFETFYDCIERLKDRIEVGKINA